MAKPHPLPAIAKSERGKPLVHVVPLTVLAAFAGITLLGQVAFPLGIADPAIARIAAVFSGLAIVGAALRRRMSARGEAAAAWLVESFCLFVLLSLFAALASAVLAVGGGDYVDGNLAASDLTLFPWFSWRWTVATANDYSRIWYALNAIYITLNYQPLCFLLIASIHGKARDHAALLAGWATALACCILPFHFLPAQGAYAHFGVTSSQLSQVLVTISFEQADLLEQIRNGTMRALTMKSVNGLVSIPSFHAAGGVLLAWLWWRFRYLRWPMAALNAAMVLSAIPVGGHYLVDIVVGVGVGLIAIAMAKWSERKQQSAPVVSRENADGGCNGIEGFAAPSSTAHTLA